MRTPLRFLLAILCLFPAAGQGLTAPTSAGAQTPGIELSPDARWMLLTERGGQPTLAESRRPLLQLAGRRLDPQAHSAYADDFVRGLLLRPLTSDRPVRVPLPGNPRVAWLGWSPDSESAAYVLESRAGSDLWVVDVEDPEHPRLVAEGLTTIPGWPRWNRDGSALLVHLWPADMGPEPRRETVAIDGVDAEPGAPSDLLGDAEDAAIWKWHATSELALVPASEGVTRVLARGLFAEADLSPDGRFLMLAHYAEPFAVGLPAWDFARHVRLVDLDQRGRSMPSWKVAADVAPAGGAPQGPRRFAWAASHAASLVWAEALDGGDPAVRVDHRDRWMILRAPFAAPSAEVESAGGADWTPLELLRTEHRATGLDWFAKPGLVLASEYDHQRRWRRATLHSLDTDGPPVVLEDRSAEDASSDLGRALTVLGPFGREVVQVEDSQLLRAGRGSAAAGDLPFLERQHLWSAERKRVWSSSEERYESVLHVLGVRSPDGSVELRFLTRHEAPKAAPNLRLRAEGSDEFLPVTDFPDPAGAGEGEGHGPD